MQLNTSDVFPREKRHLLRLTLPGWVALLFTMLDARRGVPQPHVTLLLLYRQDDVILLVSLRGGQPVQKKKYLDKNIL